MFFLFQYVSDERVMSIFFRFNSTIFNWLSANCLHEYKRKMGFVRRIHVIDSRTYVKSKELLRVSGKALVFVNYARANLGPGNSQIICSFAFDFFPHWKTLLKTWSLLSKQKWWSVIARTQEFCCKDDISSSKKKTKQIKRFIYILPAFGGQKMLLQSPLLQVVNALNFSHPELNY